MPELPEAESIVRGLRPTVVGARIDGVEVRRPDILREPARSFAGRVRGSRIEGVERRGKNVVLALEGGRALWVNLGMTGGLLPYPRPPRAAEAPTHPAVILRFLGGGVLIYDDQRRFGSVECLEPEAWRERSGRLGPEPLSADFTVERLGGGLAASRSPVRSWLLDQRRIAGVGNIYANEALHRAGIHPRTLARDVRPEGVAALRRALRAVLRQAIRNGGTTIRDYRDADGNSGRNQERLRVYGREGAPCRRCGTPIERTVFGNRSAYHCPACQPEPRRRGGRGRRR